MKRKNHVLLVWGLCNIIAPLPLLMASVLLGWLIFFGFGGNAVKTGTAPDWLQFVAVAPAFALTIIHLVSCISAFIVSIIKQRDTFAFLCYILSTVAFILELVLFTVVIIIGSTF